MPPFPPRSRLFARVVVANVRRRSTSKNADDIVITLAVRTPLTKAKKGGFKDTSLEYMIYAILKEVRERSNLDPALVEDLCLGNVHAPHRRPPVRFCKLLTTRDNRSRTARPLTSCAPPRSLPAFPTHPAAPA